MNSFNLDLANPVTLLIGLGVAAFVVVRQLQATALSPRRLLVAPALLGYAVLKTAPALVALDPVGVTLTALGITAGALLGAARAQTIRTWTAADGGVWTQGTWLTLALWAALIAIRLGLGALESLFHAGPAAMPAELALTAFATFSAQNAVTWIRVAGRRAVVAAADAH